MLLMPLIAARFRYACLKDTPIIFCFRCRRFHFSATITHGIFAITFTDAADYFIFFSLSPPMLPPLFHAHAAFAAYFRFAAFSPRRFSS